MPSEVAEFASAMKRVFAVVERELILYAVELEFAFIDAVGITAYRRTEIGEVVLREVCLDAVESEHHILQRAVFVGHHE